MTELIMIAAAVLGCVLAFMPWLIYTELQRQGAAREAEALRIISLLARIAGSTCGRSDADAASIQAALDARSAKGG